MPNNSKNEYKMYLNLFIILFIKIMNIYDIVINAKIYIGTNI
jgi:hypothetical protein